MNEIQKAQEGIQHFHAGRHEKAKQIAENLLNQNPRHLIALTLMGDYAQLKGNWDDAIDYYSRIIHESPGQREVLIFLAKAQRLSGKPSQALNTLQKILKTDPKNYEAMLEIAQSQYALGDLLTAEKAIRLALHLKPECSISYYLLGLISKRKGEQINRTLAYFRKAIEFSPENIEAHIELANYLIFAGDLRGGCASYLEIMNKQVKGTSSVISDWLFFQHNLEDRTPEELYDCHLQWLPRHATSDRRHKHKDFSNTASPQRPLRVGFNSPDFYAHSVFFFLNPLFSNYDRGQYSFICFSDRHENQEDVLTKRIIGNVDEWYRTKDLDFTALDAFIREKQIDILIDLTGHTGNHRLLNYMKRGAPVQVNWLGYPNTTGLDSMDYRIVDAVTDPEPKVDGLATEALFRIPSPFLCFGPPEEWKTLEVKQGITPQRIVFGSFNSALKLSDSTIALWCKILQLVPNSELVIKCRPIGKAMTIARLVNKMQEQGIHENRLRILDYLNPLDEHLMAYNEIDLALDPFPYNGTTTSVEAMWMGVPFITKEGDRHCARVGMTLLKSVGLEELIAESDEAYVQKAVDLANNREKLTEIKRTLRQRMLDSPLCDAEGFARKFEAALREMWTQWCKEKTTIS